MRNFIAIAMDKKTWKRAMDVEIDMSVAEDVAGDVGLGYTVLQSCVNKPGDIVYAGYCSDSMYATNSDVSVSASKRLGKGVVARARLRSVKLEREDVGPGDSAWLAGAKIPCLGRRGAGARGRRSSSTSGMGDMAFSEEDAERDVADVRREWALLDSVGGFSCPEEVFA
jgi:hypothetical protein